MGAKYHFIIFVLVFHYGYCKNCDCSLVDILKTILQKEMIEREILASRVDKLESKLESGIRSDAESSGNFSDTVMLERLAAIENLIDNFKAEIKEATMDRRKASQLNNALSIAWKVHKHELSIIKEDIQNSIINNNKSFKELTSEVNTHIKTSESKVESLINQTSAEVKKQTKEVENRLEEIRFSINSTFKKYKEEMDKDFAIFGNITHKKYSDVKASLDNIQSFDLKQMSSSLGFLTEKAARNIAFTAFGSTQHSGTIRFHRVILNVGEHYDSTTGVFVCPFDGLYHFAVTLTKNRQDIDLVTAYITVNGFTQLELHSDPDDPGTTDVGSYSISGAGTFSLNKGGMVSVTGTSSNFYDDKKSFFTGFRIS